MVKVLITGVSGLVGSFTYLRLKRDHEVLGTSRNRSEYTDHVLDLTDRKKTAELVEKTTPDLIVHCAKIAKSVDYCEANREECRLVNATGTKNLVDALGSSGSDAKFIYLSTDYVYDGKKGGYTEKDDPNPVNYYGQSKLEGETYAAQLTNHLILRTTVVYGYHAGGNNFFMQLLDRQNKREPMKVPCDQISNPTYVHLLMEIIERSINKDLKGLYLATGPEPIGRYDFALKIADYMDYDKSLLEKVSTPELKQDAERPLNCSTNPEKLQHDLAFRFPSLDDSLDHLKKEVERAG
ncbi:MAG: SDR family oxidoreductase [Candidatus Altiarchaeota archaeon]|nr:SDR family oxidoreductase [Candidatus Altiarchaeota archaeon]